MTRGNSLLTSTRESETYGTIPKPRPEGAAFSVYDWRKDAIDSFHFALHMKALQIGAKRFSTVSEMYWVELNGSIP